MGSFTKRLMQRKKNVYSGFTHNSLNLETVPVFINRKTDEQTDTFLSQNNIPPQKGQGLKQHG